MAIQIIVNEDLIPTLFEILPTYRSGDTNCKKILMSAGSVPDVTMLNLALDIIRMVLDSGFMRAGDDTNIYNYIIKDMNLQSFKEFLDMIVVDRIIF